MRDSSAASTSTEALVFSLSFSSHLISTEPSSARTRGRTLGHRSVRALQALTARFASPPGASRRRARARATRRRSGFALAGVATGLVCMFPASALASNLSISAGMQGSIRSANGDYVSAGINPSCNAQAPNTSPGCGTQPSCGGPANSPSGCAPSPIATGGIDAVAYRVRRMPAREATRKAKPTHRRGRLHDTAGAFGAQ
jgi:hypothetical protein